LMQRVARLPQIPYHAQHPTVYAPEPRQYTSTLWFGHGSSLSFFSYQLVFFYREWEQKGMESLWFELRLFPIKCWGQHFYSVGTSKQSNMKINSCFIWNNSEIPFASMKRTLSIRLSHETYRNCIESMVSLFVNISTAYSKQFMGFVSKYS
jgi:hypothetical protein